MTELSVVFAISGITLICTFLFILFTVEYYIKKEKEDYTWQILIFMIFTVIGWSALFTMFYQAINV